MSSALVTFLAAHKDLIWPTLSAGVLLVLYRKSPQEWVRLGETYPRIQGFTRFLRGAGLDPVVSLEGFFQMITGKVKPDQRDQRIAQLQTMLDSALRKIQEQASELYRRDLLNPPVSTLEEDQNSEEADK